MFDFNKMIERHISREHHGKEIGKYYPSEIGSCLRKVWYSYKYPMEVKPELQKIFEVGNILHGFAVEVLKSEKNSEIKLVESELPFQLEYESLTISGRVDDVVIIRHSGKNIIVEVKSTKDINFVNKASKSHEMQLQLYMHATGIHNGVVLYIDKNNLQSKMFEIQYSAKIGNEILERFKTLDRNLKAGILPIAEAKHDPELMWMCRFCDYAEKCKNNEP